MGDNPESSGTQAEVDLFGHWISGEVLSRRPASYACGFRSGRLTLPILLTEMAFLPCNALALQPACLIGLVTRAERELEAKW